jgi:hypothetical protein
MDCTGYWVLGAWCRWWASLPLVHDVRILYVLLSVHAWSCPQCSSSQWASSCYGYLLFRRTRYWNWRPTEMLIIRRTPHWRLCRLWIKSKTDFVLTYCWRHLKVGDCSHSPYIAISYCLICFILIPFALQDHSSCYRPVVSIYYGYQ